MSQFSAAVLALVVTSFAGALMASDPASREPQVVEKMVVDKIWSGVPVGYCLLTHGDRQYIAYYNADRRTVIGMRSLDEDTFTKVILPSDSENPPRGTRKGVSTIQGWDSHNYLTMAVDKAGHIHLSGNMHVNNLNYFVSEKPHDITSMKQVRSMVGKQENRCTYPKFKTAPDGNLIFHYRHGSSGSGLEVYNVYDADTKTWKRFLDQPLVSGQGRMNAYQMGPMKQADGRFHLVWIWRETSDCSTCRDISYARSRDLVNWETAAGEPLTLPITPRNTECVVDAVPTKGGLINMGNGFGLDRQNRSVVTYHRYDKDGHNQAYAARFEDGAWKIHQITDWDYRWHFSGGGSIDSEVAVGGVQPHGEGTLAIPYRHTKFGSGRLIVDEDTLELRGTEPAPPRYPKALAAPVSDFPGMQVNWRGDLGRSDEPGIHYVLRWETLGRNRDRPRKGKLPAASDLVLYKLKSL